MLLPSTWEVSAFLRALFYEVFSQIVFHFAASKIHCFLYQFQIKTFDLFELLPIKLSRFGIWSGCRQSGTFLQFDLPHPPYGQFEFGLDALYNQRFRQSFVRSLRFPSRCFPPAEIGNQLDSSYCCCGISSTLVALQEFNQYRHGSILTVHSNLILICNLQHGNALRWDYAN